MAQFDTFNAVAVMNKLIVDSSTPKRTTPPRRQQQASIAELPPPYDTEKAQQSNNNKMLERQLEAMNTQLREAQDEISFTRIKLKEKEKRVEELERERKETARLRLRIAALESQIEIKNKRLADAEATVVVKIVPQDSVSPQRMPQQSVPARALSVAERFVEVTQERVKIMKLQKQVHRIREKTRLKMEVMERELMIKHDDLVPITTQRAPKSYDTRGDSEDEPADGVKPGARRGSLISFESMKRTKHLAAYHLPLREPLKLSTQAEDQFLAKRLEKSSFGECIRGNRQQVFDWAEQWRAAHEASLGNLWYIFSERDKAGGGILARPKDDFHKELKLNIVKTRNGLLDLVKIIANTTTNLIGSEKEAKRKWLLEQKVWLDAAVEADLPPPEDPRIHALQKEINILQDRVKQSTKDHQQKAAILETGRDKAQANLNFVQSKLFELHRELYSTLHTVHKHRFKWIPRLPDPLRKHNIDASQEQLKVQFNTHLGEVIMQDVSYLKQFAEYFVSDDLFGSDRSAAGAAPEAPPETDTEGGGVQVSSIRRGSFGAKVTAMAHHITQYSKLQKKMAALEIAEQRALDEVAGGQDTKSDPSHSNIIDPDAIEVSLEAPKVSSAQRPSSAGGSGIHATRRKSHGDASALIGGRGMSPAPPCAESVTAGLRRMQDWQARQSQLWEGKRRSSLSSNHIPTNSTATSHRAVVVPKVQEYKFPFE